MAITLNCPKCGKPFRVRDDVIGMRVKCPSCSAILQVPAALAPASLLITDVPPEEAQSPPSLLNAPMRPAGIPQRPNPGMQIRPQVMDDDVHGTFNEQLPAAPRQPTMPQMNPMPGIGQQRPMIPPSTAPSTPVTASNPGYVMDLSANATSQWRRVRGGLGNVKMGLYLLLIPALCEIAKRVYLDKNEATVDLAKPGFLHLGNLSFWQDITLLYVAIPAVIGFFLILTGRLLCMSAPGSSRTRGLAASSAFCTVICFLGVAACAYCYLMPALGKSAPMPEIMKLGAGIALAFGLLAEIWSCLFQGQVGFVLGYPSIQRQSGIAFTLVCLTAFGILAADAFYPFLNVEARQAAIADLERFQPDEELKDTAKEKEAAPKEETKMKKVAATAKEYLKESKAYVTNRQHLPSLALYLFAIIFVVAMGSVASSTRSAIRSWTALHPGM